MILWRFNRSRRFLLKKKRKSFYVLRFCSTKVIPTVYGYFILKFLFKKPLFYYTYLLLAYWIPFFKFHTKGLTVKKKLHQPPQIVPPALVLSYSWIKVWRKVTFQFHFYFWCPILVPVLFNFKFLVINNYNIPNEV